jgi:hypothetical protein
MILAAGGDLGRADQSERVAIVGARRLFEMETQT